MPIDYSEYPDDWKEIRQLILDRAGNQCEGSPAYPNCRAANYEPHPVTGSKVILTIAHMDHDKHNNDPGNLKALCQRCHLTHDKEQHKSNATFSRLKADRKKLSKWINQNT